MKVYACMVMHNSPAARQPIAQRVWRRIFYGEKVTSVSVKVIVQTGVKCLNPLTMQRMKRKIQAWLQQCKGEGIEAAVRNDQGNVAVQALVYTSQLSQVP